MVQIDTLFTVTRQTGRVRRPGHQTSTKHTYVLLSVSVRVLPIQIWIWVHLIGLWLKSTCKIVRVCCRHHSSDSLKNDERERSCERTCCLHHQRCFLNSISNWSQCLFYLCDGNDSEIGWGLQQRDQLLVQLAIRNHAGGWGPRATGVYVMWTTTDGHDEGEAAGTARRRQLDTAHAWEKLARICWRKSSLSNNERDVYLYISYWLTYWSDAHLVQGI